jgi:hypothetical protein
MSIIRVEKRADPYVRIDKVPLEDARLSWKARGLLAYLLSKPDKWEIVVAYLVKQAPDGETSLRAGLKELMDAGYIERRQVRENGKIVKVAYTVYERPKNTPLGENPNTENLNLQNQALVTNEEEVTNEEKDSLPASLPKQPTAQQREEREARTALRLIGRVWNEQAQLITHGKGALDSALPSVRARLRDGHTVEELAQAIRNLNAAIEDPSNGWTYRGYTLKEFLSREAGGVMERFLAGNGGFKKKAGNTIHQRGGELTNDFFDN